MLSRSCFAVRQTFKNGKFASGKVALTTSCQQNESKKLNEPISPHDLHRAGGISSFMRLPIVIPPFA